MYRYSQGWFLVSELKRLATSLVDTESTNRILEIGCFEGLSSVFFADTLLNAPNSTLVCVDPFMTLENNDHKQYLANNEEANFDYNLTVCKNADKITVKKITSDAFFESNDHTFTFIYIDGCHEPDFIRRDMENSFKVLETGGLMWMDDYLGGDGMQIKNTMDEFLVRHKNEYEIVHSGYQLAIRKI